MSDKLTATVTVIESGTRRLEWYWSDKAAQYMFRLQERYKGGYWRCTAFTGDAHWAVAIAKHYGIQIPQVPLV